MSTAAGSPPPSPGASSVHGCLTFLLLSPCPQRAVLAALDILFLLSALMLALALSARFSRRTALHDGRAAWEPLVAKSAAD